MRVLENVVFAQRWDVAVLTEQRDHLMDRLAALEHEHAALKTETERLQAAIARQPEQTDSDPAQSARCSVALAAARATAEIAAELVLLAHSLAEIDQAPANLPGAVIGEVLLLQASGLFDQDFYQRQSEVPLSGVGALCHYVLVGEGAGRRANPLFDLPYYRRAVLRAGVPHVDRFVTGLAHYAAIGARLGLCPGPLVDRAFCLAQIDPHDYPDFEPVSHYLQVGRFVGFTTHPLIDKAHYLRVRGGLGAGEDPVADYLLTGCRQNLSLHPLFDAAWYLERNDDVREADCDPLMHYLEFGDAEGRWPNPLFDPTYYRQHTDVPDAMPALTHYVLRGKIGARTHPLFDGAWYLQCNQDVERLAMDPLEHYLGSGGDEGRAPHPLFDTKFLLNQCPTLLRHHRNPLVAFLRSPAWLDRSPHPLFDPATYVAQVPEAATAGGVFAHFLHHGGVNQADPHPLFCSRFYHERWAAAARRDPSVAPWDGTATALAHFIATDPAHGFPPHPLFDPRFYLDHNPDVRACGISPLVHFIESGGRRHERRQPHPLFDIALYEERLTHLKTNPVGENDNLLVDFLTHWPDRPSPNTLFDPAYYGAQADDDALHPNPLADYAWQGRAARRAPHPLFDPKYYLASIAVPDSWRATLLEHYAAGQAPEDFLPHPALDGPYVLGLMGMSPTSNLTLLDHFVTHAIDWDLAPHVRFASRDHALLHPDLDAGRDDPFSAFLRQGGRPGWVPAKRDWPAVTAACEAEKMALCGIGGVAPVSPQLARAHLPRRDVPPRAVAEIACRVSGELPRHGGPETGRLAIYAASANRAADSLHAHALAALARAGFTILLVEGRPAGEAEAGPSPAARRHAQAILSHAAGGQQIGAWVLACREFGPAIASYDQVVFLSDNLVGPIGSPDRMFDSLKACAGGWWGITQADQAGAAVDAELFAVSGAITAAPPFQQFVRSFRFAAPADRLTEAAEHALSRALRESGLTAELLVDANILRDRWMHGLPAKRRWFRDMAAAGREGTDEPLLVRIAAYAERWLGQRSQDPNFGGRIRPALLFWDSLLHHHMPFLRRDLLAANPINDPTLLRLRDTLGAEGLALLHRLIAPTLPTPNSLPHRPVLRLGLDAATPFTKVAVSPQRAAPRTRRAARALPENAV